MKIVQVYNEDKLAHVVSITSANYSGDYAIEISFSDGAKKSVNFKSFLFKSLHPSISKYQDETLFKQFKIVSGNLNWNDYDLIFPVDDLYEGQIK